VTEEHFDRLANLIIERSLTRSNGLRPLQPYLTPDQVAELLSVTRGYVYEHAAELGGRRLGSGPKARLRFRLEDIERATPCLADRRSDTTAGRTTKRPRSRTRRASLGTEVELLPIRGQKEGSE